MRATRAVLLTLGEPCASEMAELTVELGQPTRSVLWAALHPVHILDP